MGLLDDLAGQLAREVGFVSARVLESDDHVSVALVVETRSVADRQRIEQLPVVLQTLEQLEQTEGTVSLIARFYREAAVYHA